MENFIIIIYLKKNYLFYSIVLIVYYILIFRVLIKGNKILSVSEETERIAQDRENLGQQAANGLTGLENESFDSREYLLNKDVKKFGGYPPKYKGTMTWVNQAGEERGLYITKNIQPFRRR